MNPLLQMPASRPEPGVPMPDYHERARLGVPADRWMHIADEPLVRHWYSVRDVVQAREETERRILREVRRGLKMAFIALGGCALWALRLEAVALSAFLLMLTLTCVPLHQLATPTGPEVR